MSRGFCGTKAWHESVEEASRYSIARAFILSKGLTSAGAFPWLTKWEMRPMEAKIMRVYKSVLNDIGSKTGSTDLQLLHKHGLPSPEMILRCERLSLFCRVAQKATEELCLALTAAYSNRSETVKNRSWLRAVESDLSLVAARFEQFKELRNSDVPKLCQRIRDDPLAYKRRFRKVLLFESGDPYFDPTAGGSGKRNARVCDTYVFEDEGFRCSVCGDVFKDERALNAHNARSHDERSEVLQWIRCSCCQVCGTEFHTISRLVQHLSRRRPNRCFERLRLLTAQSSSAEYRSTLNRHREETKGFAAGGLRAHHADRAAVPVFGPVLKDW